MTQAERTVREKPWEGVTALVSSRDRKEACVAGVASGGGAGEGLGGRLRKARVCPDGPRLLESTEQS